MQRPLQLITGLLCVLLIGCASSEDTPNTDNSPLRQTNVTTQHLQPDSLSRFSELPATVKAWHDATLSALESGVVWQVNKDLGDQVKRGDILAKLKLDVLEQMAIEAEANLAYQTYNFEHSQKLMAEGSISEQTHRNAEYDFKRAVSNAQTIRTRLSFGTIKAPFPGRIAQRFIDKGQLIPQGGPTFRLMQMDSIKIEAWVSESEILDFAKGQTVHLTLDAFGNETFQGVIGKKGPAADNKRRVYPIEVHLANPDQRILPGMVGKIKILRQTYHNVVVIPREAILERETGPVAFVATNNKANLRQLILGATENDKVVVTKGLSFGEHLIIKGNRDLIDGDPIQIHPGNPAQ